MKKYAYLCRRRKVKYNIMDKKNFSTSYIPLQKPYQIIKYGKDVGMQIGTLVASCMLDSDDDDDGPFRIESHSYPVVAYVDKEANMLERDDYALQPMEGVVWNRVELRDVMTLCLAGDHLTWEEFINLLWADIRRTGYTAEPDYDIIHAIRLFGVIVDNPPKGKHVVTLELKKDMATKEKRVCSSKKDVIAINFAWDKDIQKMKHRVMYQLMLYHLFFADNEIISKHSPSFSFSFKSDNESLSPLVKILNNLEHWDIFEVFRSKFEDESFLEGLDFLSKPIDENELDSYH